MLEEIDTTPLIGSLIAGQGPMRFARMKLPGRDLPDNAMYQIEEVGRMTE